MAGIRPKSPFLSDFRTSCYREDVETTIKIQGGLFHPGFITDFSASLEIPPGATSFFFDAILNRFLPANIFETGATFVDMKGGLQVQSGWEQDAVQARDALLVIGGDLIPDGNAASTEIDPHFLLQICTVFSKFDGPDHIVFSAETTREGGLFGILSPREVARAASIHINHASLYIDLFESTSFGSLLGMVPGVKYSLSVEASTNQLNLKLHGRKLRRREMQPFEVHPLLKRVSELLENACGFSPAKAYDDAIQKEIQKKG